MLTRELLSSGAYLESFEDGPNQPRWSLQRIRASLHHALAQRPVGEPVWLFAYGSLIWNPLLKFVEQEAAVIQGWHRSFCIRLCAGRATSCQPGRMLALDAGGHSAGVAFRLGEKDLRDELELVWIREMVHGLYRPLWSRVRLASGRQVASLAFVADTSHAHYEREASIDIAAPLIADAAGHLGTNSDYLMQLDRSLGAHGVDDPYIRGLAAAVRSRKLPSRE